MRIVAIVEFAGAVLLSAVSANAQTGDETASSGWLPVLYVLLIVLAVAIAAFFWFLRHKGSSKSDEPDGQ